MSGDPAAVQGAHREAASVMTERAGLRPRVAIVLGSGLGAVADAVKDATALDYADLAGCPRPTVAGHGGRAVLGRIGDVPVAVLQGRAHVYEGGDLDAIRTPIRALRAAGAEIVTSVRVGDRFDATGLDMVVTVGGDEATGPCDGNTITGPVTLTGNRAGVELNGNRVTGSVRITDNTGTLPPPPGPVHAVGNSVVGAFKIQQ